MLIQKVTTAPVLAYPDLERPFKMEVDASAYAVGAILFQKDNQGRKRDVGYYSKALNPAEHNYNIWDREFLAVIKALGNWRHILIGTPHIITKMQEQQASEMNKWEDKHNLRRDKQGWYHKGIALVVPEDLKLRRDLVELNHDSPTAAHPGIDKTHKLLHKQYWWPHFKEFVRQYVKGCAVCQANKPITHRNNPPLHPIAPQEEPLPFQTIAIDFIVKLPTSEGYDSIMMVTNHDCTKAVILVPCQETIDVEGVAKLFKDRIFPFVGLPKKIISDRDPRFTSAFFRELCKQLEVTQNLSTAYHPQTDG